MAAGVGAEKSYAPIGVLNLPVAIEAAVAGVKFRARKKLREHVQRSDPDGDVVPSLAALAEDGEIPLDVARVWEEERVSCPARHWLARSLAGTLPEGPASFIALHVDEIGCEWCRANREDLGRRDASELEPLLRTIQASTARLLRSRTLDPPEAGS